MLEFDTGSVRAVATDGHRLAFCHMTASPDEGAEQDQNAANHQIIVPRKGIQELARLLTNSDSDTRVKIGNTHILIELGSIRFISKLIDGKFPDYRRAIPEETGRVLLAERLALREALARTAILAGDNRGVRMLLDKDLLRVQAHNPEQEQAEEDLAVSYHDEPMEIGFNVTYLLDALGSLSGDRVRLFFADAGSSCLLQSPDEDSCKYVVSPMRL
jgi:DNA polymerase-3 subunit beta